MHHFVGGADDEQAEGGSHLEPRDLSAIGVTDLNLSVYRTPRPGEGAADGMWVMDLECGARGGYDVYLWGSHLAYLLQDSGVRDREDLAGLRTRQSSWAPAGTVRGWKNIEPAEVYLKDGWEDGPEALLYADYVSRRGATFALTADLWLKLCREVIREIGHDFALAERELLYVLRWPREVFKSGGQARPLGGAN